MRYTVISSVVLAILLSFSTYATEQAFDREALRVAHLLTGLPVVYKRGQLLRATIVLFFVFTAEKQLRYLSLH